ncbi:YciI family protein [Undibacterium sp.]|uniref:YciI family protein n=1 Tax=Undibacterium sp. TaxID=1914977 RepID=UPI003753323C
MTVKHSLLALLVACLLSFEAIGQESNKTAPDKPTSNPKYDAESAQRLGADQRGMRSYVLVVLKTGPNKVAPGKERDEMFAGHFANIKRLAAEGKLALAGPFDGVDGWRGLFVFAVKDIEEAKQLTTTDPVIMKGEMVAEYHKWYGSAAVMDVTRIHETLIEKNP